MALATPNPNTLSEMYTRVLKRREDDPNAGVTVEEAKSVVRPILDPVRFYETGGPVAVQHWFDPNRYGRSEKVLGILIETADQASGHDAADCHEALYLIARRLVAQDEPIPKLLLTWLTTAGQRPRPKRPRGLRPHVSQGRDLQICFAVFILQSLGMFATRNDASEPNSACDVVSEVLVEYRIGRSYHAVRKIWDRDGYRFTEESGPSSSTDVLAQLGTWYQ